MSSNILELNSFTQANSENTYKHGNSKDLNQFNPKKPENIKEETFGIQIRPWNCKLIKDENNLPNKSNTCYIKQPRGKRKKRTVTI